MHSKHTRSRNNTASRPHSKRKGGRSSTTPFKTKHSGITHSTKITSDETDVRLQFRARDYIAGAGPLITKAFTPNAAYDVDPALGSTETYGFDEYAALYSYYRVISYSYHIQVLANKDTDAPVTCYVLNTNTQPSGTRFDLFATNPYCQTKLLPISTALGKIQFRGSHLVSQIVGTKAPETEDNYRALTTGVPADLVWLTLAFESVAGSNVACEYLVDIYMKVRFYGREIDLTLNSIADKMNQKVAARAAYKMEKELRIKKLQIKPASASHSTN